MKRLNKWLRKARGFTLVEIMVVVLIIGILMIVLIPNVGKSKELASEKSDEALVQLVENQILLYEMENSVKNPALQKLVDDEYLNAKQAKAYEDYLANQSNP